MVVSVFFLNFRLKKAGARAHWPSLLILLQPCPDLTSDASSVRNFSAAFAQTPFQRKTSGGVAKCRLFSQAMIGNPPFSVHMINYFLKSWIISSRPLIFSRNVNWGSSIASQGIFRVLWRDLIRNFLGLLFLIY